MEISRYLRLDKGTEMGDMATIHAYVKRSLECTNDDEAVDNVQYGPSTSNKVRKLFHQNYCLMHMLENTSFL